MSQARVVASACQAEITDVEVQRWHQVAKPWGREEHFALADGMYCGKLLHITAGGSLSLQFHRHKDETVALQSGALLLEIGPTVHELEQVELRPGESVRIRPGMVHRMVAIADSVVLEASTTQLHDVVRLEDRYGRQGTNTP